MIEEKEEDKVKALETVELVEGEATQTTRIETTLSPEMKPGSSGSLKKTWTSSLGLTKTCQAYLQKLFSIS